MLPHEGVHMHRGTVAQAGLAGLFFVKDSPQGPPTANSDSASLCKRQVSGSRGRGTG